VYIESLSVIREAMKDYTYDEKTKTVWVASDLDADSLLPSSETRHWSQVLSAGKLEDGREVSAVNYVFSDAESADYNSAALSFLKLGAYTGSLKSPKPLGGPDFETKEDFGI